MGARCGVGADRGKLQNEANLKVMNYGGRAHDYGYDGVIERFYSKRHAEHLPDRATTAAADL